MSIDDRKQTQDKTDSDDQSTVKDVQPESVSEQDGERVKGGLKDISIIKVIDKSSPILH